MIIDGMTLPYRYTPEDVINTLHPIFEQDDYVLVGGRYTCAPLSKLKLIDTQGPIAKEIVVISHEPTITIREVVRGSPNLLHPVLEKNYNFSTGAVDMLIREDGLASYLEPSKMASQCRDIGGPFLKAPERRTPIHNGDKKRLFERNNKSVKKEQQRSLYTSPELTADELRNQLHSSFHVCQLTNGWRLRDWVKAVDKSKREPLPESSARYLMELVRLLWDSEYTDILIKGYRHREPEGHFYSRYRPPEPTHQDPYLLSEITRILIGVSGHAERSIKQLTFIKTWTEEMVIGVETDGDETWHYFDLVLHLLFGIT